MHYQCMDPPQTEIRLLNWKRYSTSLLGWPRQHLSAPALRNSIRIWGGNQSAPGSNTCPSLCFIRYIPMLLGLYAGSAYPLQTLISNSQGVPKYTLAQTSTMVHNHSIVGPMVHNHRKPSLPMVVLPENHRKTIDPNGCPQPFHSMVIVTLKTIESLRWQQKSVLKVQQTQQPTLNLKKILSFRVYLHLKCISNS